MELPRAVLARRPDKAAIWLVSENFLSPDPLGVEP